MDLWIRSQDKSDLILMNSKLFLDRCGGTNRICMYDYKPKEDCYFILGHYNTEERALEVLDEIQETILDIQRNCKNVHDIKYVYEMPKE